MTTHMGFTPRMEGLDALRGLALFGLFIVHMPELFELYWANPTKDPFQLMIHDTVWLIFAGKAFALLALCFGVSFFIIMDRSAQKGVDFTGRFIWRLVVLAALGLLHCLWYRGDVLEVLAVMGLFLIPFYRVKSNMWLWIFALFFLLQPLMIVQIVAGLSGAEWANQPLKFWSEAIPEVYLSGNFADTLSANITDGHGFKWLFMYESGRLSQILGLSLIGMILGRIGFFARPEIFGKIRLYGLLTALIAAAGLYVVREPLIALMPASDAIFMPRILFGAIISSLFDISVMAILMFGFTALYYGGAGKLLNVLAPVGRMTLSLYILQSLIFVPVFYGYGLGLHATMTQSEAVLIGLGAFGLQVLFAHVWFRYFYYGPLEWVWRAATYLTINVPFRKSHQP
ncbi:MAG: DUF418 domain-containing protein [Asticcacaulis sp.]